MRKNEIEIERQEILMKKDILKDIVKDFDQDSRKKERKKERMEEMLKIVLTDFSCCVSGCDWR